MKTVELTPNIHSSVLGFGCAPILGSVSEKTAKLALDFGVDNGINHLDIARSYGYGEAEKFVGKLIAGKRQKMVLASKFGITANWKASLLNTLKPFVREVRNQIKKNKKDTAIVRGPQKVNIADNFFDRIVPLRGKDMRNSLEKSLKELRTDYLDYFFIHEPHQTLTYFEDLQETSEKLKAEGKIRAWGIAYMQSQEQMHQAYINKFDLLQFNNSPGMPDYDKTVLTRGKESNIIFSPFSGGSADIKPVEKLKKLLGDFPESVILCSMFNLEHLKQNITTVNNFNY